MKVEKITPKGRPSKSSPSSSLVRAVNAGVHTVHIRFCQEIPPPTKPCTLHSLNTNMYIDPSNNDDMMPHRRMSGFLIVVLNAPISAAIALDFGLELVSSLLEESPP